MSSCRAKPMRPPMMPQSRPFMKTVLKLSFFPAETGRWADCIRAAAGVHTTPASSSAVISKSFSGSGETSSWGTSSSIFSPCSSNRSICTSPAAASSP